MYRKACGYRRVGRSVHTLVPVEGNMGRNGTRTASLACNNGSTIWVEVVAKQKIKVVSIGST